MATSAPSAAESANLPASVAAWLRRHVSDSGKLTVDSRQVRAGDAFFAYPGASSDGRDFVARAMLSGASAIVWEREGFFWSREWTVPEYGVQDLRALSGPIASAYHCVPSERLCLIAVTGTNGKTSCTQWIAQGMQAIGRSAAVIGTLGSGQVGSMTAFGLTTPDAVSLQERLAGFVRDQVQVCAMEASSIGLHQGRVDGSHVSAAVFTNLTHDHLDYHGTLQAYAAAKARLFAMQGLKVAVVNGDDDCAALMFASLDRAQAQGHNTGAMRIQYGFDAGRSAGAGVRRVLAEGLEQSSSAMRLKLAGDFGQATLNLSLLGRFNASNVMAVASTWLGLGMAFDDVCAQLESLRAVPGRMQTLDRPGAPLVVVDYAHTPDALANVLQTLRPVANARGGKVWCVFGAGGDRDALKRPIMGRTVEQFCDLTVITSDNPRTESPYRIVSDIRAGLTREPWLTELDRRKAIETVVTQAGTKDVVLIAGKGHEEYQEIDGQRLPFSDVTVARQALSSRPEHADV